MSRFRSGSSDEGNEGGIDMSPMIDCVFILLIFFIVTTTFIEESGIEVDKPQAAPPMNQLIENKPITLRLHANGDVTDDANLKIGINGVRTLVKNRLRDDQTPVILQSEIEAPAGLLVRVMDEARLAGAAKVSLGRPLSTK